MVTRFFVVQFQMIFLFSLTALGTEKQAVLNTACALPQGDSLFYKGIVALSLSKK